MGLQHAQRGLEQSPRDAGAALHGSHQSVILVDVQHGGGGHQHVLAGNGDGEQRDEGTVPRYGGNRAGPGSGNGVGVAGKRRNFHGQRQVEMGSGTGEFAGDEALNQLPHIRHGGFALVHAVTDVDDLEACIERGDVQAARPVVDDELAVGAVVAGSVRTVEPDGNGQEASVPGKGLGKSAGTVAEVDVFLRPVPDRAASEEVDEGVYEDGLEPIAHAVNAPPVIRAGDEGGAVLHELFQPGGAEEQCVAVQLDGNILFAAHGAFEFGKNPHDAVLAVEVASAFKGGGAVGCTHGLEFRDGCFRTRIAGIVNDNDGNIPAKDIRGMGKSFQGGTARPGQQVGVAAVSEIMQVNHGASVAG
uniref:Uncharacterized protein n=1 Tax=Siphoviridae sp. ctTkm23 TaxID=2825522 RepID=A0A8S5TRP2_9CAUD|nr:MAG TPA: hypothetical protein [Siphoviridae sp. ctTkm23]DAQ29896.1 MAG TPA: hypothetical protein [Caudoviricetes sp.]